MAAFNSGLRSRLVLLVLVAAVPVLGLATYSGLEQRRMAAATARGDTLQLAHLAVETQDRLLHVTHQLLLALSRLSEVRLLDAAACRDLFADLVEIYPSYYDLGLIAHDGQFISSALGIEEPLKLADRSFFRRALENRGFAVGDFEVDAITKKTAVSCGYPVTTASGEVQAVLYAAVSAAWINEFAAAAQLPTSSTLSVFDRNGTVVGRHPDGDEWAGYPGREVPIVATVLARGSEGTETARGLDNIERIYGYGPLRYEGKPIGAYVVAGVPTASAFAEAHRILVRNVVLIAVTVLLAVAAAHWAGQFFILRGMNCLVAAAQRLAGGDYGVRARLGTGPTEVRDMGRAFDAMAASLQQRELEQQRAEQELRESEARYEDLYENAPDMFYSVDAATKKIIRCNKTFCVATGYSRKEIIGRPIVEMYAEGNATRARWIAQRFLATGEVRDVELQVKRKDGSTLDVILNATAVRDAEGRILWSRSVWRDITERKRLEREILEISDREQRRIGQDLHDGLCQRLTAVAVALLGLEEDLAETLPVQAIATSEIASTVDELIAETRDLAGTLHPVQVANIGLCPALEKLAIDVEKLCNIRCRFTCDETVPIRDVTLATHLYRITQEALANAVKHGKPSNIDIDLHEDRDMLTLTVRDDGLGLPEGGTETRGMGLHLMAQRARMIEGLLELKRGGQGGKVVTCCFPHRHPDGPG